MLYPLQQKPFQMLFVKFVKLKENRLIIFTNKVGN